MDCGTHSRQENSPTWKQHNDECCDGMLEKGPAVKLLLNAPAQAIPSRSAGAVQQNIGRHGRATAADLRRAVDRGEPFNARGGLRPLLSLEAAFSSGEVGHGENRVSGPRAAAAASGSLCWIEGPRAPGRGWGPGGSSPRRTPFLGTDGAGAALILQGLTQVHGVIARWSTREPRG
ncbi:hypothetical protein NDU88_006944 [Pleurodeles waltl]|uniref:Uncharacterized protein n=1 Tax=Pleurodeles waltl TaxID=8319 RepID=A0AAV7VNB7_PLEWA|nr:hypothetical protein NDU88_006944 [Pleurodeles waltl]